MSNIKKRTAAKAVLLIALLILSGCNIKKDGKTDNACQTDESRDYGYMAEYTFFQTGGYRPYISVFGNSGTLFYGAYKEGEGTILCFATPESKQPVRISIDFNKDTWITGMGKDVQGNILFLCNAYGTTEEQSELIKISESGNVLERIALTDIFSGVQNFEAASVAGDNQGNCYVAAEKTIYVINAQGELAFQWKAEEKVEDILYVHNENHFYARLSNGRLMRMEQESKELQPVKHKVSFQNGLYENWNQQELLYSIGTDLYSCDMEEQEPARLLDWIDCGIDTRGLQSFMRRNSNEILVFLTDPDNEEACELVVLKKMKKDEIPEKVTITYGCLYANTSMQAQIVLFNRVNQNYHIELKQYGEDSVDMETGLQLMQMDIVSGHGPDVIDIGYISQAQQHQMAETGILTDLNLFWEQDEEIKRDDYIENVLQTYERDGRLYAIMPTFDLQCLVGKASDIGEYESWTLEEMMDHLEKENGEHPAILGVNRTDMLDLLCRLNLQRFIDKENGICSFQDPGFQRILEMAARCPKERESIDLSIQTELVQDRKGTLLIADILSVTAFQMYESIYQEPIHFIGYPSNAGKGIIARSNASVLAINSNSKSKEGAWEFIRFILQEKQQQSFANSSLGFPLKKSALEQLLERQMEKLYEVDENGNQQEKTKEIWEMNGMTFHFYALTKKDAGQFEKMLQMIENPGNMSDEQQIYQIIEEEAEAFFSGQKEINDVIMIIQSRAQNYMNENR